MNSKRARYLGAHDGGDAVVGDAGEQVDHEPRAQVAPPDDGCVGHHLAVRTHERRVEVQDDVHAEHDVHQRVQHQ